MPRRWQRLVAIIETMAPSTSVSGGDACQDGVLRVAGLRRWHNQPSSRCHRDMAEYTAGVTRGLDARVNPHLSEEFSDSASSPSKTGCSSGRWRRPCHGLSTPFEMKNLHQHVSGGACRSGRKWQYQKDAASRAVRDLTGVKGVTNSIIVRPRVTAGDVRDKLEAAFKRSAEIDARRVNVSAQDGKVIPQRPRAIVGRTAGG